MNNLQIVYMGIDKIIPYANNPRINEKSVDKVAASIKEFGFQQPIVVGADGVIIVGHTRYKAALKLGLTEVPVIYAENLTDEQVKAYRLADNKTAEFAEWDIDTLGEELAELKEFNFDMEPFGFEDTNETIAKPDNFRTRSYDRLHFLATVSIGDIEKLRELEALCVKAGIEYETMGN